MTTSFACSWQSNPTFARACDRSFPTTIPLYPARVRTFFARKHHRKGNNLVEEQPPVDRRTAIQTARIVVLLHGPPLMPVGWSVRGREVDAEQSGRISLSWRLARRS